MSAEKLDTQNLLEHLSVELRKGKIVAMLHVNARDSFKI
jgi:hypothetical protein